MAQSVAFHIPLSVTLAGSGQGTLQYVVPQTAVLHVKGWIWKSAGAFNVIGIQDNTGIQFTNATQTNPIISTFLPAEDTPNDWMFQFPLVIDLIGGKSLNINLIDTSTSSNLVQAMLYAVQDYA